MNTKKLLALALGGGLLAVSLTGCTTAATSQSNASPLGTTSPQASDTSPLGTTSLQASDTSPLGVTSPQASDTSLLGATSPQASDTSPPITASPQMSDTSPQIIASLAEDHSSSSHVSYEELFRPYEQFGLAYDSSKNELQYHGKTVRWFEDYYAIADGGQAGNDFFNENGVVDVYAVRDFTGFIHSEDGSFDPSGKLVGVNQFSQAEFAARDIESIKNPPAIAIAGGPPSPKELEDMAKEYEAFGVTYDIKNDQWYFNGEKVRFLRDVLTSNGEELTSGKFKGAIRSLNSTDGIVNIYTIRDFNHVDASGNGTLTGIGKYTQEEFDEHTRREEQTSSGFCTVVQE